MHAASFFFNIFVRNFCSWFVVNGNFTSWENIGECSNSCGGGTKQQRRSCTNPSPTHGGNDCTGNTSRTISCNNQPCTGIQLSKFCFILNIRY